MHRVIWQGIALDELDAIRAYLEQLNPAAAARVHETLFAAGNSLAEYPERGRLIAHGRRELVAIFPYLIRYRLRGDVVQVLRVRHGARRPEG